MKHKLLRGLVALVLVCCMIVNCIAIKAEASVLGGTVVALFGDDAIALIAACLMGLGVLANLETEMDTLTFRYLCQEAYDAMAAAGEWVVDGAVTVYNCSTELWDYGVDCGMVQWLHEWLYSESYIYSTIPAANDVISDANIEVARNHTYTFYATMNYGSFSEWLLCYSDFAPITYSNGLIKAGGEVFYCIGTISSVWKSTHSLSTNGLTSISITTDFSFKDACVNTDYDLALGTVAAPGTEIETEYGEYIVIVAPNGVPETGGDGSGDDEQPEVPVIPIPVLPSYEETIQLPQEDIWKGNKVETEDPDTGGSTDPTTGTDTDPDTGTDTDGSLSNTPWETFKKWISTGWESIIQAIPTPDSIAEAVGNVIKSIFVPDADFISDKWNSIRSRFDFADSISSSGELILDVLNGIDPEPPVIYIDLGASEGSYDIGGEVPFLDLRWYERYKPTGDAIISAFLWLVFAWRMFIKLPGIIGGLPGDFVMQGVVNLGLSEHLPARKKEYEYERQQNRRSMKK